MKVTSLITRRGLFVFVFALVLATASSIIAWTGPTQSPPNGNVAAPLNTGATAQTKTGDLNITGASGLWATGVGSDNGYCIGTDCITAWSQAGGGSGSSQWTTVGSDIYYNTGNVGIGNAAPSRRLHLEESGQFVQMLWRAGTGSNKDLIMHYGENTTAGNQFRFGRYTRAGAWEANPVMFDMNAPSGSVTLNSNGMINFSRGGAVECCSTANATVSIAEDTSGTGAVASIQFHNSGVSEGQIALANGGYRRMYFSDHQSSGLGIETTGNITAPGYFHTSDATLKKDISTFSRGLDVIKRLRGVTFNWKKDDTPAAGVIAQEVEQVMPEAVQTDEKGIKSVDYDQLIAPMIEAIKEQQKQIEAQQQEIASLKHEVESLKVRR